MTSRRLQIILSVVVIFVCTGFLVQESIQATKPVAGRSELSGFFLEGLAVMILMNAFAIFLRHRFERRW